MLMIPGEQADYMCIDFDLKYKATVAPHEISKVKKGSQKSHKANSHSVKVLDICCGRGGDISKISKAFSVDLYVGLDISLNELIQVNK